MKADKYYESLLEQLLQCTADDFALQFFFNVNTKNSIEQNKHELQMCVEFIYRCLKCNLLKLNIGYKEYSIDGVVVGRFNTLEDFISRVAKKSLSPFNKFDDIDLCLWMGEEMHATNLLDKIAEDCHLVAYEDEVKFSDPRGQKFREEIERIFTENGLPWDLENPLFPVP